MSRDTVASAAERGTAMQRDTLAITADLRAGLLVAHWRPVHRADVYRVRLLTSDGTLLLERDVRDTVLATPLTTARSAAQGQRVGIVFWDVRALDSLRHILARGSLRQRVR